MTPSCAGSSPLDNSARITRSTRRASPSFSRVSLPHAVGVVVRVPAEGLPSAVGHQPQTIGGGAQQVPVVGYEHDRALVFLQGERERMAHFQIQVIGRLVQQQQIGPLPHQQGQRQPGFLAPGKRRNRFERHVAAEIEAAEEIAQFLLARARVQAHKMAQR